LIFFREVLVRQCRYFSLILLVVGVAGFATLSQADVEPQVMGDDIFDMLIKGFNDLSRNKFPEAQAEFENILKIDSGNPYANNNMAVLLEKQGKLAEAMTYLQSGEKLASRYLYQLDTAYLIGGICAAVNPEKTTAGNSPVARVISDNKKKLTARMGLKTADFSQSQGK
jgi:Tfp pilus assembly protein PilF